MSPVTITGLAALMGCAILRLQTLQNVTRSIYAKPLTPFIGYDPQRADWKKLAPVAALVPLVEHEERGQNTSRRSGSDSCTYTVGLVLAVVDDALMDVDGVACLRGLDYLSTATAAIREALPDAVAQVQPLLTLTGGEIRYDTERHPLLQAEMMFTLTHNRPIGG